MKRLALMVASIAAALFAGSADATRWKIDLLGAVVNMNGPQVAGIALGDASSASFIYDDANVFYMGASGLSANYYANLGQYAFSVGSISRSLGSPASTLIVTDSPNGDTAAFVMRFDNFSTIQINLTGNSSVLSSTSATGLLSAPFTTALMFYSPSFNGQSSSIVSRMTLTVTNLSTVPEPASWATMLMGFGAIGGVMRSRRHVATMPI